MADNIHIYNNLYQQGDSFQIDHTTQTVALLEQEPSGPTYEQTGGSYAQICNDIINQQILAQAQALLAASQLTQILDASSSNDTVLTSFLAAAGPQTVVSTTTTSQAVNNSNLIT